MKAEILLYMTRSGMGGEPPPHAHTHIQLNCRLATRTLCKMKSGCPAFLTLIDQLTSLQPELEIFNALVTTLLIKPLTLLQPQSNL